MGNQRQFERFSAQLKVGLVSRKGHICLSETTDLSEGGMLLTVPEAAANQLQEDGTPMTQGEELRVSMSNAEKTMEFTILCTIAHVSIESHEYYKIGLHFEDRRSTLKTFIQLLLKTLHV